MNESRPNEHLSSEASIALSLWFALSSFAAVTGNAIVLWLLYKNETLQTISNRYLASLSVADLSVGLVVDPLWIVTRCWIQPPLYTMLSDVLHVLWVHTATATTFNICCVSINRFIAIRFPLRYQEIVTKRRCYTVIILVWLSSLSLSASTLFMIGKLNVVSYLSYTCIIYVAPLLVVSFCYISIFKAASEQYKRTITRENFRNCDGNIRVLAVQNFIAIKTIGFVLGVCIITWMPSLGLLSVVCYYVLTKDKSKIHELFYVVWPWVDAIAFTLSAINPLIYYFRNDDFRRAFRRTFHRWPFGHVDNSPAIGLNSEKKKKRMVRNDETTGNLAS
ncbi:beta-1 adrenergic receptor-like [Stylophora pistillata]|uniref:beta-1 adrenergic receptor-like n=1 Tax=Stylophora pistillata TaxID=50429 RepID=UPI000C04E31E|nr:beta-1 adrenergic receptor-like [Stylophora pistillata]